MSIMGLPLLNRESPCGTREVTQLSSLGYHQSSAMSAHRHPENQNVRARRWIISGRVQGVGFRWFVIDKAQSLGLTGWVRNEPEGTVHAYAVGPAELLDQLAGFLHMGPRLSEVRSVEQLEAAVQQLNSFRMD